MSLKTFPSNDQKQKNVEVKDEELLNLDLIQSA
jgi:hypothetical protein